MWRIGHRGAQGYEPENTSLSIKKAIELGVDGVEFDIQISKDGIPVVIHDDTLDRTTNGKGYVHDFSLRELQRLDAGDGETILSLQEAIEIIDERTRLFIELKAENSVIPVTKLLAYGLKNLGWNHEKFFICSFNHLQLKAMRSAIPDIRTCALFEGIPTTLAKIASEAGAWSLNPPIYCVNQELVNDAHARNLRVITWEVNSNNEMERAHLLGVDGIISDFPDRF
ncbi:MAG: glycerophosphodiester phosphodiesterase family protein [Rickettsiales bacterium]